LKVGYTRKWPPTTYVNIAVMRYVKLYTVGQLAGQKMEMAMGIMLHLGIGAR